MRCALPPDHHVFGGWAGPRKSRIGRVGSILLGLNVAGTTQTLKPRVGEETIMEAHKCWTCYHGHIDFSADGCFSHGCGRKISPTKGLHRMIDGVWTCLKQLRLFRSVRRDVKTGSKIGSKEDENRSEPSLSLARLGVERRSSSGGSRGISVMSPPSRTPVFPVPAVCSEPHSWIRTL